VNKLEAILFDVDGTLIDTEELHRQAYNETFVQFGLGWDWNAKLYADLLSVSGGEARIAHYIDQLDLPPAEKTRLRRIIPAIHRIKTKCYGELIASNSVRLRSGVARLMEEGRRSGVRIGLAASSASANVQTLVASAFHQDVGNVADAIVCADEVARKKPAPDIYELLLTLLRVAPSACVAFEDSNNGLNAAKAAGLFTVVTPTRWTMAQKFDNADLVLPGLGDPQNPPEPSITSRIGWPYLELAQLEALRSNKRSRPQLHEAGS
jgi:HAD superfamily hydrolase (TIGR01509 family)